MAEWSTDVNKFLTVQWMGVWRGIGVRGVTMLRPTFSSGLKMADDDDDDNDMILNPSTLQTICLSVL